MPESPINLFEKQIDAICQPRFAKKENRIKEEIDKAHKKRAKLKFFNAEHQMGMSMAFCHNCGEKLPEDALFCPKCGTKTEIGAAKNASSPSDEMRTAFVKMSQEMEKAFNIAAKEIQEAFQTARKNVEKSFYKEPINCTNCGEKNAANAAYCFKCGNKLSAQTDKPK